MLDQFNENGPPMTRYEAQTMSAHSQRKPAVAFDLCLSVLGRAVDWVGTGSRKQTFI